MSDTHISLKQEDFIAAGAYCQCYKHPSSPEKCIKIPTDNKKSTKRLKADLSYHNKLHKRQVDLHYIADCLGSCETNLGKGYVFQCVTDYDGTVSKTLYHHLEDNSIEPNKIINSLLPLAKYLLKNRILISDIHSKNILIKITKDSEIKPVIIDGIGDTVAITFLNIFKAEVRSKIIRRWNRFVNSLKDSYPQHSSILEDIYLNKQTIET